MFLAETPLRLASDDGAIQAEGDGRRRAGESEDSFSPPLALRIGEAYEERSERSAINAEKEEKRVVGRARDRWRHQAAAHEDGDECGGDESDERPDAQSLIEGSADATEIEKDGEAGQGEREGAATSKVLHNKSERMSYGQWHSTLTYVTVGTLRASTANVSTASARMQTLMLLAPKVCCDLSTPLMTRCQMFSDCSTSVR